MADKYQPIAYYDGWYTQSRETITVLEDEKRPIDSGLLDARGVKLYRIPEKTPIGFMDFSKPTVKRTVP